MEILDLLFRFFSAILSVYMVLLTLRILMTWFPSHIRLGAGRLLAGITDPYLNLFRSLKFLRTQQGLDFTPLAAFLVLNLVLQVLLSLQSGISWGDLAVLPFQLLWSMVSFFLGLIFLVALLRLVTLITGWGDRHRALQAIDSLIQPLVVRLTRIFTRRLVTYRTGLVLLMASSLVVSGAGGILLFLLRNLFRSLLG